MRRAERAAPAEVPIHLLVLLLDAAALDAPARARFAAHLARQGRTLDGCIAANERVPLAWLLAAMPTLQPEAGTALGYAAGAQARLTSFAALSLPMLSAGSIGELLHLLHYLPLISNSLTAQVQTRRDDTVITLDVDAGHPVLDRVVIGFSAGALQRLLTLLVEGTPTLELHLAGPEPAALAGHADVVAGRLRFGAPFHHLVVPNTTMTAVCRFSDPIAYQGALRALDEMRVRIVDAPDLPARVRALLDTETPPPGLTDVADRLHLSVSTLKRRLADAGTGFRSLREDCLQARACRLLSDPTLSLPAVAAALGYHDLANFAHAFKRWTGTAPGTWRRQADTARRPSPARSPDSP